jgi:hypothetical protein
MYKTSKLGFTLIPNMVDTNAPLLYCIWTKPGPGALATTIYVGQTRNGCGRPFQRYDFNLRRLLSGKPPLNGKQYRPVIYDLRAAYAAGHEIAVELVRNVDLAIERITDAERQLQEQLGVEPVGKTERRMLTDEGRSNGSIE